MKKFTEEQINAIKCKDNHILLIAGPGSGKTTVLTSRVAYMINELKINDEDILVFTYTTKAERALERKLNDVLGREHNVCISNFHSFAYNEVRDKIGTKLSVVSDSMKKEIIKNLILERNYKRILRVEDVIMEISRIKNDLPITEKRLEKKLKIIEIYYAYEAYLMERNKIDFDGMCLMFLNKLETDKEYAKEMSQRAKYILVDEAQDINNIQYRMMKILSSVHNHLFMVGDTNQNIYTFRGANVKIFEQYTNEYEVTVLHLCINHRSTKRIVGYSNNLISNNENVFNQDIVSAKDEGEDLIFKNPQYINTEANYVADQINKLIEEGYNYKDILILYRQNKSKGIYDKVLSLRGIPHYLCGTSFLEYREIKSILGYYRLVVNHNDNDAFTMVVNVPARGIADVTMSKIRTIAITKNISYYETARISGIPQCEAFIKEIDELTEMHETYCFDDVFDHIVEIVNLNKLSKDYYDLQRRKANVSALKHMLQELLYKNNYDYMLTLNELSMTVKPEDYSNQVRMMTIHQSKGLEAKVVFIVDARDDVIPGNKYGKELEEERRVFYVGITRAEERLYILASEKNGPSDKGRKVPSRFISELERKKEGGNPSN